MSSSDFAEMMKNIQRNYTDATERKASVSLYVPEIDSYVKQDMYMTDVTPIIMNELDGMLFFGNTRIAFIGY